MTIYSGSRFCRVWKPLISGGEVQETNECVQATSAWRHFANTFRKHTQIKRDTPRHLICSCTWATLPIASVASFVLQLLCFCHLYHRKLHNPPFPLSAIRVGSDQIWHCGENSDFYSFSVRPLEVLLSHFFFFCWSRWLTLLQTLTTEVEIGTTLWTPQCTGCLGCESQLSAIYMNTTTGNQKTHNKNWSRHVNYKRCHPLHKQHKVLLICSLYVFISWAVRKWPK